MQQLVTTLAAGEFSTGHVLGSIGAGGAALAATVFLFLGVKGKHRIKLSADQAAIVGLVAGTLYAAAASVWSAPGNITKGLAASIQNGIAGNVGMGAIAAVMVLVVYGCKLKPRTAACFGIAAASIFAAAGGIWGVVSTTLASGLNQVLGVA
ncbi:hypothetical protein [Streptomyces noursei]|uniref:hypothetical protein n=1 Tax=Streptomyces noursei TaxID=1971 RepID=UPI00381EA7BD